MPRKVGRLGRTCPLAAAADMCTVLYPCYHCLVLVDIAAEHRATSSLARGLACFLYLVVGTTRGLLTRCSPFPPRLRGSLTPPPPPPPPPPPHSLGRLLAAVTNAETEQGAVQNAQMLKRLAKDGRRKDSVRWP